MPRPKKADAAKQPQPTPVAPAPAPVQAAPMAGYPQQPMQPQQAMQMQPPQMAPAPMAGAPYGAPLAPVPPRVIDVDQFVRVRDSTHNRFTTIIGLMKSFSDDFIRQTNLLLGEPTPFDNGANMQSLVGNLDAMAGQMGEFGAHGDEKKERKKRHHDPNAPKRPLTPYFLYMQTARSIIANDLGPEAPKGAVQEEGQRRWASMAPHEKQAWNNAYQFNLRLYSAKVHSFKAGNLEAKNMSDNEAHAYADQHGIAQAKLADTDEVVAPANDQDAIAEQLGMGAAIPPPATPMAEETPKAKGGRKRKSAAADAQDPEASAVKNATPASPEKKRKRQSKAAQELAAEEPKKSSTRKKKN